MKRVSRLDNIEHDGDDEKSLSIITKKPNVNEQLYVGDIPLYAQGHPDEIWYRPYITNTYLKLIHGDEQEEKYLPVYDNQFCENSSETDWKFHAYRFREVQEFTLYSIFFIVNDRNVTDIITFLAKGNYVTTQGVPYQPVLLIKGAPKNVYFIADLLALAQHRTLHMHLFDLFGDYPVNVFREKLLYTPTSRSSHIFIHLSQDCPYRDYYFLLMYYPLTYELVSESDPDQIETILANSAIYHDWDGLTSGKYLEGQPQPKSELSLVES